MVYYISMLKELTSISPAKMLEDYSSEKQIVN
jgi:hypothetical protein